MHAFAHSRRPLSEKERLQLSTRFIAHVQDTNRPEDFPGVVLGPANGRDVELQLLVQISVVRSKRGEEMVPCSFCSPEVGKWVHGGWAAWFPDDQLIRLIGPTCGGRHLSRFEAAIEEQKEEIEDLRKRTYIYQQAPVLRLVRERLPKLIADVGQVESFVQLFKQKAPAVFLSLERLAKAGKPLSRRDTRRVPKPDGDGGYIWLDEHFDRKIGDLHGASLFDKNSSAVLTALKRALVSAERWTPEAALAALDDPSKDYLGYPVFWKKQHQAAVRATAFLRDARIFVSPHAIALKNEWGKAFGCPSPMRMKLSDGIFQIVEGGRTEASLQYKMADVFRHEVEAIPPLPRMPKPQRN